MFCHVHRGHGFATSAIETHIRNRLRFVLVLGAFIVDDPYTIVNRQLEAGKTRQRSIVGWVIFCHRQPHHDYIIFDYTSTTLYLYTTTMIQVIIIKSQARDILLCDKEFCYALCHIIG